MLRILENHWDIVDSIDLSADGRRLVSGGYDGVINLWDADSGELLVGLQSDDMVDGVAISPDGRRIAAAERDGVVYVFSESGDLVRMLVAHDEFSILAVDFGVRGDIVVSGGDDATIRFWDAATGQLLRTLLTEGEIGSLRFSPDGRYLACTTWGGEVMIWGVSREP